MSNATVETARRLAISGNRAELGRLLSSPAAAFTDDADWIDLAGRIEIESGGEAASSFYQTLTFARENSPQILISAARHAGKEEDIAAAMRYGSAAVNCAKGDARITDSYAGLLQDCGYGMLAIKLLADAIANHGADDALVARFAAAIEAENQGEGWLNDEERFNQAVGQLLELAEDDSDGGLSEEPEPVPAAPVADAPEKPAASATMDTGRLTVFDEVQACPDLRTIDDASAASWAEKARDEGAALPLMQIALLNGAWRLAAACAPLIGSDSGVEAQDYVACAQALADSAAPRQAIRDVYRAGAARFAGDAVLHAELAKALFALDDHDEGLRAIEKAHALDPGNAGVTGLLADIYWRADDRRAAFRLLEDNLKNFPGSHVIRLKLAGFLHWDDQGARSGEMLDSIDENAMDAASREFLITLLIARGRAVRAEAIMRLQIETQDGNASARHVAAIRALPALIWPSMPNHVNPAQVADLLAALDAAQPPELREDDLWRNVWLLAQLKRPDDALSLTRRALAMRSSAVEAPCHELKSLIARLLGGAEAATDIPASNGDCAAALNRRGLAWLAAHGEFEAACCFMIASALAPHLRPARLNSAFMAATAGRIEQAKDGFSALARIYEKEMSDVAWPSTGGRSWPFGVPASGNGFELPDGMQWPRITVITPSFNQGRYIEETILSVLNQNYPALEYIVVDACSDDETGQILERYRKQLAHLIIEPDKGQTDAINKGLKLASGDLIAWLNSDDMYAPGALHAMAQAWTETKADVLFGACLPHRNYRFELANMPAVRQETFTPDDLGQIFELWLKGHYFYQPEVMFTREMLQKAGGLLDERLNYTMDYELWMRFASLGARIEPVYWPVALFRHHDEQKTKLISDCIIEQGAVREKFAATAPSKTRQEQIRTSIAHAVKGNPLTLGIVSSRLDKIFSRPALLICAMSLLPSVSMFI